jgi:[acyl-carrier-protein] S-malonyltransferase
MKVACIFPGQGSQSVGMGLDLYKQFPTAKKLFEQIDQIAGRPLSSLCFNSPTEELKRTINTQSAILAASLAAWECYCQAGGPQPAFVAGHSLGEFSALCAAKVLSLDSVIHLVEKRGQLMEECPSGAMSAILGINFERLKELCIATTTANNDEKKVVVVANFNTEEQLVISGDPESVSLVSGQAKAEGAKVIPLPVSGAFHSPLMEQAAKEFSHTLTQYHFADACYPVIQNAVALAQTNGIIIKNTLDKQITNSVLWYTTIKLMLDQGVTHFVEIGPGKVLSGMVKRIAKTAQIYNIEDSASLNATIAALTTRCS